MITFSYYYIVQIFENQEYYKNWTLQPIWILEDNIHISLNKPSTYKYPDIIIKLSIPIHYESYKSQVSTSWSSTTLHDHICNSFPHVCAYILSKELLIIYVQPSHSDGERIWEIKEGIWFEVYYIFKGKVAKALKSP